ncbi:MAG: hypothetical protein ABSG94_12305 [Brevinematales bacterium]|jgi:hypothetical protein
MTFCFFEWAKILTPLLTPIIAGIFGVILLYRIESIKNEISKKHDFNRKWADEFFIACKEFMQCVERYMTLLHQFQAIKDPKSETSIKYQKECTELNAKLPELEMRIKRLTSMSPKNRRELINKATDILSYISSMIKTGKGNFDEMILKNDAFNAVAKIAHAEMLEL